jgi:hypothetical protein
LNPILFVGKKGKPGKDEGKKKKEKQGKAKVRVPPSPLQSSKTKGRSRGQKLLKSSILWTKKCTSETAKLSVFERKIQIFTA